MTDDNEPTLEDLLAEEAQKPELNKTLEKMEDSQFAKVATAVDAEWRKRVAPKPGDMNHAEFEAYKRAHGL
jgi:hypothetical protein